MPTDIRQYLQELAKKAGLSPELTSQVTEVLGNDAVSKVIAEGFKPLPDYSRDLDRVRDETKSLTEKESKARFDDWFNREVRPGAEANFKLAQEAERYRALYGDIDGAGGAGSPAPTSNNGNYLTRDELQRALAERDGAYVGLSKTLSRISIDHFRRFGSEVDLDAVEKIAKDSGVPADIAYERHIAPKVAELTKQQHEKDIADAREQGRKDALSNMRVPIDAAPREGHLLFDPAPAPADSSQSATQRSLSAFMSGWSEATSKP